MTFNSNSNQSVKNDTPRNSTHNLTTCENIELEVFERTDFINDSTYTFTEFKSTKQSGSQQFSHECLYLYDYDISILNDEFLKYHEAEEVVRRGHQKMPSSFPRDRLEDPFPLSLL